MGYAVLHLEKAKGSDSAMSAHIERKIAPKNADSERTYLNRELIDLSDENRTQAIQHRLETAGLTRKIGTNQVRAIRVLLTGTHEDMKRIEAKGQLDTWCKDNINWLIQTYGAENLVSAVLHLDEKTPHIHATIIPIVATERKRRKREETTKKKYKTKLSPRLCADEVMSRAKLKEYQNTYAEAMQSYGLSRGIEGSDAKHISTAKYYRDLIEQSADIQQNISELLVIKEQEQAELSKIKASQNKEKFKNSAAEVGTKLLDSASSILGTSKVKRLETENEQLRQEIKEIKEQSAQKIEQIQRQADTNYDRQTQEFKRREQSLEWDKTRLEALVDKIFKMFPRVAEILKIESLCKAIGFAKEQISRLLRKEKVQFSGTLSNPKTGYTYRTNNATAHITTDENNGKMTLNINNQPHDEWFNEQQHRRMYPHLYSDERGKGWKM